MDADKRHQLKSNELAEALAKLRNFWNDPQTLYWLLGLVVIAAAYGGYRLWTHTKDQQLTSAWRQLSQAGMGSADVAAAIADLEAIIRKNSDHGVTASSRIRLAAALRHQAEAEPARREELLRESVAVLAAVVQDPAVPMPLVAAATFSLGTSYESLREYDQARATYESLAQERFAGSPFQQRAAERLATLDDLPAQSPFVPGAPAQPEEPAGSAPPTAIPPDTPPAETQPSADPPVSQEVPQAASGADVPPQAPEPHNPDADRP